MANKGVTQEQVSRAADALVAAGERPTVERIRAHLGSGSPNTVTRLLEIWWSQLGGRLTAQQAKLALPEAPAAVAGLASQLWEQALASAQAHATDALDGERQDLAIERAALEDMRVAFCDELEAATVARLDAKRDCAVALTRVGDLQRLLEQQAAHVQELGTQRDQLRQELDAVQALVAGAQGQLHERDALLAHERAEQTTHLRAVEDRAHAEVDRARQETKALQTQLAAQEREWTTSEKQLRQGTTRRPPWRPSRSVTPARNGPAPRRWRPAWLRRAHRDEAQTEHQDRPDRRRRNPRVRDHDAAVALGFSF